MSQNRDMGHPDFSTHRANWTLVLLAGSTLERDRAHNCGAQNEHKRADEDEKVDHERSCLSAHFFIFGWIGRQIWLA